MNSLNSILLEGNLTRDPVSTITKNGTSVCTFGVASNRYYKKGGEGQNEVSFFDVETWSKLAENCGEYLSKGRGVRVVGRLKQDRWVDTDGKPQSKVKIVAEHVEFKPDFKTMRKGEQDSEESELEAHATAEGSASAEEEEVFEEREAM